VLGGLRLSEKVKVGKPLIQVGTRLVLNNFFIIAKERCGRGVCGGSIPSLVRLSQVFIPLGLLPCEQKRDMKGCIDIPHSQLPGT
jgi:hypothetical protein